MKPRFSAQEGTITKSLVNTMKKMQANNLKVNKELFTGKVEILFDRNGRRYIFCCDNYELSLDNYRAAQLCLDYLYRALESYGVTSTEESLFDAVFENFFLGFEATPNEDVLMIDNKTEWNDILGVNITASKDEIKNAFRSLSKVHHPDFGGDKDTFIKLRKAYEKGMEQ